MIKEIHKWEKAVVTLLNLDGWNLTHSGEGSESWDAVGKTPKSQDCVIEMKFRNKYYDTKIIEKFKDWTNSTSEEKEATKRNMLKV